MKAGLDNQQISSYLKDKAAHSAHAIKAQAHTTKEHAKSTVKNYMVAEDSTAPVGTSSNPSYQIYTVANAITFCRLILTFIFLVLFISRTNRILAFVCYMIAAVTDFLDGQVARRTQTVSWLGKIMDPIMDRVLLATGVLGLVITEEIPVWIAVFVILRDTVMACGALILQRYQRRPLDVIYIGKIATACLMFGFCDALFGLPYVHGLGLYNLEFLPGINAQSVPLGMFFIYVGIVFSSVAAITYIMQGLKIMRSKH